MKRIVTIFILFLFLAIIISSCNKKTVPQSANDKTTNKTESTMKNENVSYAGPSVLIYKTNGDYYSNVPVILSEDKTKIMSFPDIKDIYYNDDLAYPIKLKNGYLLDRRGVGINVAFLTYTYEEYSKLEETPSANELMKKILNSEPLIELYDCGSKYKYKNLVEELNEIIEKNQFNNFKKVF